MHKRIPKSLWHTLRSRPAHLFACIAVVGLLCGTRVFAQGNYEIQVYGSDTVAPKSTMLELHSNFTPEGQRYTIDGVYPTNHQEHETIEITQGINDWSEVGFYIFTSEQDGHGVQWRAMIDDVYREHTPRATKQCQTQQGRTPHARVRRMRDGSGGLHRWRATL